ncbi:MAG: DUF2726 domain-containing protein [Betaproteobacteria bacterium]|nr:DUF2726 domain-containing protein [Betaproteobacteria bacterium]
MSYALKSLLTPDEARLAESVQTVLKTFSKPGYKLIYKFQPSTFLHRDRVESAQPSAMKAFFEGIILIGVVEDKIKGSLLCAVLDKRNEYSDAIVDLLGEFKIPCHLCDLTRNAVSIENELRRTLINFRSERQKPLTKGQGNAYENWLTSRAHEAFDGFNIFGERVQIFVEPCLGQFVDVPKDERELYEFSRASRVDCLLTGPSPAQIPMLVLEMDGPEHEKKAAQIRDGKKEAILAKASLPLIRLRISDAPEIIDPRQQVYELKNWRLQKEFEASFVRVLKNIISGVCIENLDVPQIWAEYDKAHLIRLKALVTAYRREHSTLDVPESVLQQMYLTIYEELEDLGWKAHGIEGGVRSMNKEAAIEIPNDDMLTLAGSSVQGFEVDSQNATAILRTPFGDWTIRLPTPRIRYLGNVLPGFEQDYKAALYSWMEGMVHRVAHQILVKEKIPTAISVQKLRKCRAHWRRPWNAAERKALFRMRDDGFTLKQIAEILDRSEYAVAIRAGQKCDHGALLRKEVEEAIRLA